MARPNPTQNLGECCIGGHGHLLTKLTSPSNSSPSKNPKTYFYLLFIYCLACLIYYSFKAATDRAFEPWLLEAIGGHLPATKEGPICLRSKIVVLNICHHPKSPVAGAIRGRSPSWPLPLMATPSQLLVATPTHSLLITHSLPSPVAAPRSPIRGHSTLVTAPCQLLVGAPHPLPATHPWPPLSHGRLRSWPLLQYGRSLLIIHGHPSPMATYVPGHLLCLLWPPLTHGPPLPRGLSIIMVSYMY